MSQPSAAAAANGSTAQRLAPPSASTPSAPLSRSPSDASVALHSTFDVLHWLWVVLEAVAVFVQVRGGVHGPPSCAPAGPAPVLTLSRARVDRTGAQRVWRWFWYRGRKRRAVLRKMDVATSCAEWRSQGALLDRSVQGTRRAHASARPHRPKCALTRVVNH